MAPDRVGVKSSIWYLAGKAPRPRCDWPFFVSRGVDAFLPNLNTRCAGETNMSPWACAKRRSDIPNCFSAKSKSRAKSVLALSFAALCALGLSGGGARAGFLEDLVGVFTGDQRPSYSRGYANLERQRQAVRRHASSLSYLPRQRLPRKAAQTAAATAGPDAKNGLCYAERPSAPDLGQPDAILHDATLREGDSVMTAQGVRVFQGGSACPHKESDFLALADARDVPKSSRGALIAIEKAVNTPILGARAGSFAGAGEETPPRQP